MKTKLKIITPDGIFINNKEVDQVYIQTTDGDMAILANHSPIVATLKIGTLTFKDNSENIPIHVHRGIVKVSKDEVKVLTERLYLIDEQGNKIDTPLKYEK